MSWREYHIDTYPILKRFSGCNNIKYGGNRSVRVDPNSRPLMIIGQDETMYHQLIFSKNHWKGHTG